MMPEDFKYSAGDRPVAGGNYETTPGAADAMLREMSCGTITGPFGPNGEPGIYGNRARDEMDRPWDDAEAHRQLIGYHQEVADRHLALGGVADVTIDIGDPEGTGLGRALLIQCRDLQAEAPVVAVLPFKGLV